jgi:hypothetical protein
LILWLPYVHRKLLPSLWWRWLVYDVGLIVLVETAVIALIGQFSWTGLGRLEVFAAALAATALLALCGLLAGGETRQMARRFFRGDKLA